MKKAYLTVIGTVLLGAVITGCTDKEIIYVTRPDTQPPATPRGVRSITGDRQVVITWSGSDEVDLAGYRVWRSTVANTGPYVRIGQTVNTDFVDGSVINGNTYWYAVSAFDQNGNESDLSPETVFDTPRPEGFNQTVWTMEAAPTSAGFDFSSGSRTAWDSPAADIFLDEDASGVIFINAATLSVDLQDFGFTTSLDDVDFAPTSGWSQKGWVEAIKGHSYVIWTANNHFAKLRITDMGTGWIIFDWAYQIDPGNAELVKPKHDDNYLKRAVSD